VKGFQLLAVVIAVAAMLCLASWWAVDRYGGPAYVPGLISGFAATLVAFVLALELETLRTRAEFARADEETNATRVTEARKRLLALRTELEKNKTSIGEIAKGLASTVSMQGTVWHILHPQLLDGAWSASGERLGDLLADYELVSELSVFYGRLEELRWRIRYRTQASSDQLDGMTLALANEMATEVTDLIDRVSGEERKPGVRGVTHIGRIGGSITPTGTVTLEKVAADPGASG
jgi:hypothetical protein